MSREEMEGFGFSKLLLLLMVAVMVAGLSSTLDFTQPSPYRLPIAVVVAGTMVLWSGFHVGGFSRVGLWLLYLWMGYAVMSTVSALVNREDLLGEVWQLAVVPLLVFAVFPRLSGRHGMLMIAWAALLGLGPYVLYSLAMYPMSIFYAGVFANANTMGITSAILIAAMLVLLRAEWTRSSQKAVSWARIITLLLPIMLLVGVLLASSSRTSWIAAGISFAIFGWTLFIAEKQTMFRFFLLLTVTVVISLFLLLSFAGDDSQGEGLMQRFLTKSETDLLSGRTGIWWEALSEANIFGHGSDYFPSRVGFTAHNNMIDVLGTKGIIAVLFRFAFELTALVYSAWFAYRRVADDGWAAGPLLLISSYLVTGMAETTGGILGTGSQMILLLSIGVLARYEDFIRA